MLARVTLALALASVLWAWPVRAQEPGGSEEAIVAEILRLDSIWLNAYVTGDAEAVRPLIADDFQGQILETIMNKEDMVSRVASSSGIEEMVPDRRVVNVYGEMAAIHARWRRVEREDGVRVEFPFVYTDVYVFRDGRWQCITGQSAPIPDGG